MASFNGVELTDDESDEVYEGSTNLSNHIIPESFESSKSINKSETETNKSKHESNCDLKNDTDKKISNYESNTSSDDDDFIITQKNSRFKARNIIRDSFDVNDCERLSAIRPVRDSIARISQDFRSDEHILSSTIVEEQLDTKGNSTTKKTSTENHCESIILEDEVKDSVFEEKSSSSEENDEISSSSSSASLHSILDDGSDIEELSQLLNSSKISNKDNVESPQGTQADNSLTNYRNIEPAIESRSPSPDSGDVIEVSSSEDDVPCTKSLNKPITKQMTLVDMFNRPKTEVEEVQELHVSPSEYKEQLEKVKKIESDLLKTKNTIMTVNLNILPDKGELLKQRQINFEKVLMNERTKLEQMVISKEDSRKSKQNGINKFLPWEEIQAAAGNVQPRTKGKQAMSTYNVQKALTLDRLQQLHGSLKNCPNESTLASDPKGLTVELMVHQKRALAWLIWREQQKPSGGILADDMGLGKTLTMISLMLKTNQTEKEKSDESDEDDDCNSNRKNSCKYNGGTLVVCPASLLNQWSNELANRTKRGLASFELFHGPRRETKPAKLAQYDMVITTYSIVNNEKNGPLFRIKWRRIILDEAHQIRNHKSQTSTTLCGLAAKSRWAVTGTPVHNKELDMYSLLKFLRCTPFDDLQVWKRWVGDKSTGGQDRLHTVISSLMLRRTKVELLEKGILSCVPERKCELISVNLNTNEMDVYQRVLIFSRTLFSQFLHQRAEKNQDRMDLRGISNAPNAEYFKMREKLLKLNKVKEVSQHEILVLLLRLRQICCHPILIMNMLRDDADGIEEYDSKSYEELDLLAQLNKLKLDDDEKENTSAINGISEPTNVGLKEASKGFLNPSNPVFSNDHTSTKIEVLLDVLKKKILKSNDKAVIVSQWPSFLRIIGEKLKDKNIVFEQLDGSVPVNKRMTMVDNFNNAKHKMKVLLLSLTAGGVGLNLVGANHLLLLDLHWNPQLENQAQDRIYRVGQQKPVHIYKFIATGTIEERIKTLQDKKIDLAESLVTGSKQAASTKLSLQDLKMLFDM